MFEIKKLKNCTLCMLLYICKLFSECPNIYHKSILLFVNNQTLKNIIRYRCIENPGMKNMKMREMYRMEGQEEYGFVTTWRRAGVVSVAMGREPPRPVHTSVQYVCFKQLNTAIILIIIQGLFPLGT